MHPTRRLRTVPWAVALLLLVAVARPALAQGVRGPGIPATPAGQPSMMTGWKDEHRARVLGTLVPGLGHLYAEEFSEAKSLFTVSAIGVLGGTVALMVAPEAENSSSAYGLAGALGAIGIGAWVWSAFDAPRAARRTNARRILHRGSSLAPFIRPAPSGAVAAGIALTL